MAGVIQVNLRFDKVAANAGVGLLGKKIFQFHAAERVDASFKGGDALNAPRGIGERLNQDGLFLANGLIGFEEASDMASVEFDVFAREQDGASGQSGVYSVEGVTGLPGLGGRSGGVLRVGTVGNDLGSGGHGMGAPLEIEKRRVGTTATGVGPRVTSGVWILA